MSSPCFVPRSFLPDGHNFYAGSPLDRAAERRGDGAFIAKILHDPATLLVPVWRDMHLLRADGESGAEHPRLALPPLDALGMAGVGAAGADRLAELPWIFLGLLEGRALVALDLGESETPPALYEALTARTASGGAARFEPLRRAAPLLAASEAAILAQAGALVNWRRRHGFCGVCGGACRPVEAGHVMRCAACATSHFPRTDPAVIMRVTRGAHILLARGIRFREARRFSVLAGFVEPGESLEEAVARELREEVGIHAPIAAIRYHSSQPWPFPANLMLGFTAEIDQAIYQATGGTLTIDETEIVEARWFTREEVGAPDAHGFDLPQHDSIARRLIDEWLAAG